MQKQVNLTESVLEKCETREKLHDALTKLYDYPRYDVPFWRGDKYFYFHNTGLQPQRVLYMQVCDNLSLISNKMTRAFGLLFYNFPIDIFRMVWMESQRFCLILMDSARMELFH